MINHMTDHISGSEAESCETAEYLKAVKEFENPGKRYLPYVFFEIKKLPEDRDRTEAFVKKCADNGIGCIIPSLDKSITSCGNLNGEKLVAELRDFYRLLFELARKYGLHIAFNIEKNIEKYVVSESLKNGMDIGCKSLYREDYFCGWNEDVSLTLKNDKVKAVIAYSHDFSEYIDLSDKVKEGMIHWKAAYGNWVITQYICDTDPDSELCDYLNYDCAYKMVTDSFALFEDLFELDTDDKKTLHAVYYNDVCYNTHNRANWTDSFDGRFESEYGFSPRPHYAALYHMINVEERHIKTLMLDCRARMLKDGIIKAVFDFSKQRELAPKCVITEPKLSACSFITGDAMLDNSFSPCALLDKSYLYGVNSIKLAAGAAYNFNHDCVNCEVFRDYSHTDYNIIRRDIINALSRGANDLMLRLPNTEAERIICSVDCLNFVSRVQTLLRGGEHVSDIAMLYPIYSLHSKMYLYKDSDIRFEYPDTPVNTDYMTLANSISTYSGHDLTILHPDTLEKNTYAKNKRLYLDSGMNHERYKILVLPCTEMISLASLERIREFFDCGGKIIATGKLPTLAFEYDATDGNRKNDARVCEIIDYIFGKDASDESVMREFCYNKNENGGEAYFLYFSRTAADGTNMTLGSVIHEAIKSFNIPLDLYVPKMPRFECSGALNNNYGEFLRLHLDMVIPGGGMFSRLHKRRDGLEIYYFSNTTNRSYDHTVYLRGAHAPECFDPHSGTHYETESSLVRFRDEIYTKFTLKLAPATSLFILSDANKAREKEKYTQNIPVYLHL